ncbi:transcriptional regulator [candidate division GN15 bacterium]|uniref:Transcriptional regulator n=1 Tax=candidate division GN15 bacterium TaxID=2072418 RepID=A0A855X3W1_9BACT|nr:MAG: transcriptional regulator [candidate division GN15 bacterium]
MKTGATKRFVSTTDQQIDLVARCFQALSDPTRLKVIRALKSGEKSVQDLCEQFTCSQPNISRHLSVLTAAGLVSKNKRGSFVMYSVADPRVFELCDYACRHVDMLIERYTG